VWFSWTAPASRDVMFTTCDGDTAFDTVLQVITTRGKIVAENDDQGSGPLGPCAAGDETDSGVLFFAQAGQTYLIRVASYEVNGTGDFSLAWGDSCARFELRGGDGGAVTWSNAMNAANADDLQLATIGSQWEYDCVVEVLAEDANTNPVWLGGSDARREGTWQWYEYKPARGSFSYKTFWKGDANGSAPRGAFTAWYGGEPNDVGEFGEDCLAMYVDRGNPEDFLWNDADCDGGSLFVTEIPGLPS
jgi:hypothetical protein